MSDVYLIHEPVQFDRRQNKMVPLRVSEAVERYGELKVVFPGADRPPRGDRALPVLAQAMGRFRPCDYLVLAGDWDIVVWAAVLAAKATAGKIKLLKWNNRAREYDVIEAPPGLWADPGVPVNA